jgi:hypothetical protein
MTAPLLDEPSRDEQFYARALAILVGPTQRVALLMRACNLVYWAVVIAALGWLCAQVIDRQVPVVVREATLLTPEIKAGEPIRVAYLVNRLRTCETDVMWSVYDGAEEIHRYGPLHIAAPGRPGPDSFVHAWSTPGNAAPGRGRLRVVLAFACPGNYLQAIYPVTDVLPDLPVTILAGR